MRRFFVFSAIFLIFASCKTNKDENSSQKSAETTFVQVERGDDAKIYSTIIFESVSNFFVDGAEKKDGFSYDKNSGEIIYSQKGKSFKIEGKFLNPPVFVLQENICENPFIFYDGRELQKGIDYDWDEESSTIRFHETADLDEGSYCILWFSPSRDFSLLNNFDDQQIIDDWFSKNLSAN